MVLEIEMREKKDLWNFAKMVVANTLFKHEKRRRYSWKRPGDSGRYQLDYILVRQKYRNSVKMLVATQVLMLTLIIIL